MGFTSSRSDRGEGAVFGPPPPSRPDQGPDVPSALACDDATASAGPSSPPVPLRLREGTQLLGRYEGSAYERPTYLVRRGDGQVIHLSHLLYLVAVSLDGERDLSEIAAALSVELDRAVVGENVEHLVETKLRPSGLIANDVDDDAIALTRSLPLLALRYRKRVIPARLHRGVTTALRPAFWPPVVVMVVGGLVGVNIWLFCTHRAALTTAVRQLPFHPNLFLLVTFLVIFSGFFHELGHATATRYGGGSPGVMGVGIYLAWPAFYTDLTDSYRLNRAGRLRADLGGVYFNAVLIVAAGGAYLLTGFGPLAVFIVVSQAMAMYQFLPFIRLDGYYIMSDLVGVPNLFAYLGPVLASTFHRSDPATNAQLHLLKRRARIAIKVWSAVTVAFLAFNFGGLAVLAPVILPAEWVSIRLQGQATILAFARQNVAVGVDELVSLVIVAIAPAGLVLIAGLLLRRALRAIRKWWPTYPKVTTALAVALAALLLFQGQGLISRFEASTGSPGSTAQTAAAPAGRPTPAAVGHTARTNGVEPASSTSVATTPLVSSTSAPDHFYVVQAGDTLSGIAADRLGNPEGWPTIFSLNVGRPQPDGQALVDPDLIYPGWRLEIPGSQSTAALIPQPTPPVSLTDDAVAARLSVSPPTPTGFERSGAGTAPPATPVPTASDLMDPPNQLVRGQALYSADGTSAGGDSAGETIDASPMTFAQPQTTATNTTTTAPSIAPTGECAHSPQSCRDDIGPPAAPPPEPASQQAPPPKLPAPSPQASPAPQQPPLEGSVHEGAAHGQSTIGVPDERGPPDAPGR